MKDIALFSHYIGSRAKARLVAQKTRPYLYGLMMLGLLMLTQARQVFVAYASTATPVPSDTPVALVIPINAIFTQANNWISTLSPIVSLSIGVVIAVAVFAFLSNAIKSAVG